VVLPTVDLEQYLAELPDETAHRGCAACGSGQAADALTQPGSDRERTLPTTAIRFGFMRYIGDFTYLPDIKFTCGAKMVVQTKRGIEIGDQVAQTCSGCDRSVHGERTAGWIERCGNDSYILGAGRILREATASDLAEHAHIQSNCDEKRVFAQQVADRLQLAVRIVVCEHVFGGERIIFFFTAPERVDYRALVKELAKEYRTRIEMRQIGARDEARLLADFETCGREVCCKSFLKTLKPVSMRMAKLQKATLDPSQVSGRCGRLKCCLRYEHLGYEELEKNLPRIGTKVCTELDGGVVVSRQIITQLVQIRTDADKLVSVAVEDILPPGVEPGAARSLKTEPSAPAPAKAKQPRRRRSSRAQEGKEPGRGSSRTTKSETEETAPPGPRPKSTPPAGKSEKQDDSHTGRRRRRRRRGRRRGPGEGNSKGNSSPPRGE